MKAYITIVDEMGTTLLDNHELQPDRVMRDVMKDSPIDLEYTEFRFVNCRPVPKEF